MNYYEELGVTEDATEQEIRKAHRRLVKLMHPDAQPDQNLKLVAETQMRRLNSISSTLLDPEQRRIYDEQLHASSSGTSGKQSSLPGLAGIPWWIASAIAAVVLTLAAVWLWADHMSANATRVKVAAYSHETDPRQTMGNPAISYKPPGSSSRGGDLTRGEDSNGMGPNGIDSQTPPTDGGASIAVVPDVPPKLKVPPSAPTASGSAGSPHAPAIPNPLISQRQNALPTIPSSQPSAPPVTAPRKTFSLPAGSVVAKAKIVPPKSGTSLPPPPGVNASPGKEYSPSALSAGNLPTAPPKLSVVNNPAAPERITTGAGSRDPLEGEWVYAPKEPEKRKAGFYPPEFIDLKLFLSGDPGSLRGQYNAKYVVTDRPVSSEVSFELASVSKGSRRFIWQSTTGAKGTLNIDPIDERTIRIDWRTTSAVRGPALTSGTATLVRRQ